MWDVVSLRVYLQPDSQLPASHRVTGWRLTTLSPYSKPRCAEYGSRSALQKERLSSWRFLTHFRKFSKAATSP